VFFYNPSTRTSVWERPEDLVNRSDVDKLVCGPPDAVVQNAVASGTNTTPNAGNKRPETSEDEATPAKKAKTEAPTSSAGEGYFFTFCGFVQDQIYYFQHFNESICCSK